MKLRQFVKYHNEVRLSGHKFIPFVETRRVLQWFDETNQKWVDVPVEIDQESKTKAELKWNNAILKR